jgi:transcriptional regulator with XRE-family HTH domain
MTPAQCRAARALLDITQSELAAAAGLGLSTVVDFEKERRQVSDDAIEAIQGALERAGIAFKGRGVAIALPEAKTEALGKFVADAPTIFRESTYMGSVPNKIGLLSSAQIRAARALLRWSAADLARHSALGVNTIRRAEVAEEGTSLTLANDMAIRRVLEAAGVVFIDENGGGVGVRLRARLKGKSQRK